MTGQSAIEILQRGPRIGELFAGYGGLGMGVQAVLGGEIAWFSEFDAAPSKILAHNFPGIPNHGDITLIDWSTVEPVDILTGGFPCQDVSLAGARRGLKEGTRSGLWSYFAEAIGALKPELVVIENVRGLLSASAGGSMEPDPWGVGDGATRPVVNALGAVLGDLADLGYDAEWTGVRAADAGAPHGRFRVFIVAHPRRAQRGQGNTRGCRVVGQGGVQAGWEEDAGRHRSDRETAAAYSAGARRGKGEDSRAGCGDEGAWARGLEPERSCGEHAATDPSSERLGEHAREPSTEETGPSSSHVADGPRGPRTDTDWGPYLPAVRRWEAVTRSAPAPTNGDGKNGSHRLSAHFVEWMMGLPEGHVTDVGLTRNEQLKALGNGVVPQQAALALRVLLSREVAA